MVPLPRPQPRIKLAIVGGGPSAFYAASRMLQLIPPSGGAGTGGGSGFLAPEVRIHVYDRLWAPHGLVRYGVAPDHPEVKNCTHKFDEAAKDGRLSFFGNVNVGSTTSVVPHAVSVPLSSLFPHYTHLLLSSGCTVPRTHPALPLSSTCRPAIELVHWYTQHPASQFVPPLDKIRHVSVIGHGNVALDVTRMLLSPVERLEKYDVPESVLEVLRKSTVRHVSVIGRRGPLEASFTTKELRELVNLEGTGLVPIPDELFEAGGKEEGLTRQQTRLVQLLRKGSGNAYGSTEKTWSIDFFRSPTGIVPSPPGSGYALRLTLAHTTLDKERRAVPTGETSIIETDLVLTSLGYRADSELSEGWYDNNLGTVRNQEGRVVDSKGRVMRNVYTSGWAATGAKGVLASTMMNAHAIVDTIISDFHAQSQPSEEVDTEADALQTTPIPVPPPPPPITHNISLLNPHADIDMESIPEEVQIARKEGKVMSYEGWKRVDEVEVQRTASTTNVRKEKERMGWDEARTFIKRW